MSEFLHIPAGLLLTLVAYLIGCASPGPSNMAIMATAMSRGRSQALALACGVLNGSVLWGICAAFGLSALMQKYSWSLVAMKVLGGGYMLWLSWKAAREAFTPSLPTTAAAGAPAGSFREAYLKGLAMHLTNPKAIFLWVSIVAMALPQDATRADAFQVVACCAVLGFTVFFGYALAFSTALARTVYRRIQRWFNATLSLVFAYAGLRMMLSRTGAA